MTEATSAAIAAAARQLLPQLEIDLRLYADAMGARLARDLGLVPWDRVQVLGQLQARIEELRARRVARAPGPGVRVREREGQPLEAIPALWAALLRGRRVRLVREVATSEAAAACLRPFAERLPPGVLTVDDGPGGHDEPLPDGWVEGGVEPARPRVVRVRAGADPELSAYVIARACLRRDGADPRGVRQAFLAAPSATLVRHLRRLLVGARFGPPDDPAVFAGPVTRSVRDDYLAALACWQEAEGVRVLCSGGLLSRGGDPRDYLAPALFEVDEPRPDLPLAGPMLVLNIGSHPPPAEAEVLEVVGGQVGRHEGGNRRVRGALLVERLPAGLPEPRPA